VEVGRHLFEARQRRGLTVDDISKSTKIPVSLLRAIERDDAARLPQGFFTRAFVRAYANEVGVNADDLLDTGEVGEVEHVTVEAPVTNIPIHEPSSSRSLLFVVALAVACAVFYRIGAQSTASVPVFPVQSAVDRAQPAAFAPPACAPAVPAVLPDRSVRRSTVAAAPEKPPAPQAHIETSVQAVESAPPLSETVLPDPAPSPVPVEQF
jgi:hypothetical protein